MKDHKQKGDVISLDDLPENAIIVVTVEGSERVLDKRELLGAIERGLVPGTNEPGISKAQESAGIRHLLEAIAAGDLKAASVKIEELYGLGGAHYLSPRLFVQKVTYSVQKAKAAQKGKDALTQLLAQLYKGR